MSVQSKALRERWLLDGAPSSGENEFQRQLQEDEAKTRGLEQSVLRWVPRLVIDPHSP